MASVVIFIAAMLCIAKSMPVDNSGDILPDVTSSSSSEPHRVAKRFVNPALTYGAFSDNGLSKLRTKRDAEDCEKLELCRLHARSSHNFMAAFELYFVNKENAKLWDHHQRSMADCRRRFEECDEE